MEPNQAAEKDTPSLHGPSLLAWTLMNTRIGAAEQGTSGRKQKARRKTPRKTGTKNFASLNGDEPLAPHGIAAGKRVADAHREVKLLAADWRGNVDHWGGIAATGDANIVREHGSLRP